MKDIFKDILITYSRSDFYTKLSGLRQKIIDAANWPEDDPRHDALNQILTGVRTKGDKAVTEFTKKFDDVNLTAQQFRVTPDDLKKAHDQIDPSLLASIRQSIKNVRQYQTEIFTGKTDHPGVKYTPIERVGVCIPGASAPLPSTVIMTVVPAQVAGVKDIAVISPPRYEGSIHPVILAVCYELGVNEVYRIGGAPAKYGGFSHHQKPAERCVCSELYESKRALYDYARDA